MKRRIIVCTRKIFDKDKKSGSYFNYECKHIRHLMNSSCDIKFKCNISNDIEYIDDIDEFDMCDVPDECPFRLEQYLYQGVVSLKK